MLFTKVILPAVEDMAMVPATSGVAKFMVPPVNKIIFINDGRISALAVDLADDKAVDPSAGLRGSGSGNTQQKR